MFDIIANKHIVMDNISVNGVRKYYGENNEVIALNNVCIVVPTSTYLHHCYRWSSAQ